MFKFDLQLFGGGGGTTVNNTTTYTPTEYELQLQKAEADYANAVAPNALYLNNTARNVLQNSLGTVQVDYNGLNNKAQSQISNAQNQLQTGQNQILNAQKGYSQLANGQLPSSYLQNMTDAVKSGVQNTYGTLLNNSANNGVLNSSVTSQGLRDISNSVADTMAQSYTNNINTLSDIYGNQVNAANSYINGAATGINGATAGITTAAAAQEAAQTPALNLWNASLGLNGSTTSALAAAAGKGTSTSTSTQSGSSGGFLSGLLGGL